ncbi:MAG: sodium:solute symporter [Bacteroidales bacterium]|nr:sodium:solute symporter [Bacteroidales bacterium]MBQ6197710.1 sodium:solute symporter [Bacteroidales bacterium]
MAKDFYATRSTAWWKVAFAMIGSCMSGVTFVSVPGMVGVAGWGYLQMCLGFFLGYLVIAFVLTPLYFKLNVVSVYQYLENRFGISSYKTGAWFFFVSKMLGAAVRLFLMCATLCLLLRIPIWITVIVVVALEWAYTVRGGVKAVIGLDIIKTICMLVAVGLTLVLVGREVGHPDTSMMRVFYFDDVNHPQFFWKQLLGGLFTVVACTGLDQDLMQRTLACKNVKDSQKNLVVSVILQIVVISLFLLLGVYLYQFAALHGIDAKGDALFPAVTWSGALPKVVGVLFVIGLVMAGFPAGGSALTALTTSFTVDILGGRERSRVWVHTGMAVLMAVCILVFNALNSTSVIDAVYRLASYTYGPILGLFAFGLCCKAPVRDKWVPLVAIVAPVVCLVLDLNSVAWFGGYHFSYEILPLNGLLTMAGLWLIRK